ncbi:MAG: sodium:proton exchanger [Chthoniobacterales bacterium]|nr:MAG: sodium:proton exchanger [Chthoniobacterales bacterium]
MFEQASLPLSLIIFAAAGTIVWVAGIYVSKTTDVLSARFGLGEALGGLILLAIVTNLPELAITASGAMRNQLGIATGNILGGIAIQTVVLVLLDAFALGKNAPLTFRAASLDLVLEAVLVVAILTLAVMGHQLPASLIWHGITPDGVLICGTWIAGIYLIGKARDGLPWQSHGDAPGGQRHRSERQKREKAEVEKASTAQAVIVFTIAAVATLVAGVALQQTSEAIAQRMGMSGVVFGATILAGVTALPEISTGFAAVRMGDFKLAISDIFGGNAFLPVLFLLATVISGKAVLPAAQKSDMYVTGLGILLTAVYIYGLIFRPRRQIARMGIDSLIVLILYVIGIAGLFAIG